MLEPGLDRHEWESRWESLEEALEDSPRDVLPELDLLVEQMLEERGYAIDGDTVVGSVALRDLGGNAVELKRMYLRPDQRGRGLGKRLLGLALDWARANGMRSVRLDTSERMVVAQRLYEANGFRRVSGDAPRQGQCRLLYELRF